MAPNSLIHTTFFISINNVFNLVIKQFINNLIKHFQVNYFSKLNIIKTIDEDTIKYYIFNFNLCFIVAKKII